jgi:beta-glucanase (GH16 family)
MTGSEVVFEASKSDSIYKLADWEIDSNYLRKSRLKISENKFQVKYAAGGIISREKFHYGLYELRFMVEKGPGIWPAFWFYGGKGNEEIDVFELKGERLDEIHVDTHCPKGCAHGYKKTPLSVGRSYGDWLKASKSLNNGYNVMMLDWRKDELFWFLNGFPVAYFRGQFNNPMNIFVNTSVARTGEAFSPGPDSTTTWPNKFVVDYLRIWEQDTSGRGSRTTLLVEKELSDSTRSEDVVPVKQRKVSYSRKKFNKVGGCIFITVCGKKKLKVKVNGPLIKEKGVVVINCDGQRLEMNYDQREKIFDIPSSGNISGISYTYCGKHFVYRPVLQ